MHTKRELQIMKLRKKGLTHKQIAKKLGITERTSRQTMTHANAKTKIAKMFEKKEVA